MIRFWVNKRAFSFYQIFLVEKEADPSRGIKTHTKSDFIWQDKNNFKFSNDKNIF